MKKLRFIVIIFLLTSVNLVKAQASLNVTIAPPMWGPVGYTEVRYYYLPAVESYYDIQSSTFIYYSGGAWVHRASLPSRYRNYDLYSGYKVVMVDYQGQSPYDHFKQHKIKYSKNYNGGVQHTIGEHPGKGQSNNDGPKGNNGSHKGNNGKRKNH
jgi:hypothetical protein